MIRIEHVDTLILFGIGDAQIANKPGRTFHAQRTNSPGKCQKPGCPGWVDFVRRGDVSVMECDICGAPIDPGMDPGDIEMQGRAATEGRAL